MTDVPEFCRLDRRKRAIIDAARSLFVEQGFERTTLGEIVERAGGSLATVYKVFGNKDGLLDAVVFEKAASAELIIQHAFAQGGSPSEVLHRVAQGLRTHFLDPEVVALVRIVIARSVQDVDFARNFFERTAKRDHASLKTLFAYWQDLGIPMTGTPDMLSECQLAHKSGYMAPMRSATVPGWTPPPNACARGSTSLSGGRAWRPSRFRRPVLDECVGEHPSRTLSTR